MAHKRKRQKFGKKKGLPPGSLVYTGRFTQAQFAIDFIRYGPEEGERIPVSSPEEAAAQIQPGKVNWINFTGLQDTEQVDTLGKALDLHNLLLEDVLNTDLLPKVEEFDNALFFTLKMISLPNGESEPETEHISLVLGEQYLISFQEREGDVFGPIRERILQGLGKVRQRGNDYLFYLLIDAIAEEYYSTLEQFRDRLYDLEEQLVQDPASDRALQIMEIKRELQVLRKVIVPLKEAIAGLLHEEHALIADATERYIHDLSDHMAHINALFEEFREMADSLMTLNMTNVSNSMNNVMKTLTVIATIFIPLTFIAGIFGMNFSPMPGAESPYGFWISIVAMVALGVLMWIVVRRRRWF